MYRADMRDKDVRTAVRARLAALHRDHEDTLIVEEMGVWASSVRIDLAVINGELAGFELKSDRDTLDRLPLQARVYSQVFDRLTLVVGSRHLEKAVRLIPDWWEVIVAQSFEDAIELEVERAGGSNPSLDAFLVANLLWKDEALDVLDQYGLAKGWRGRRIAEIHRHLSASLPLDLIRTHVRQVLRSRNGWLR